MDEILSSIRQIIADDDASVSADSAPPPAPEPVFSPEDVVPAQEEASDDEGLPSFDAFLAEESPESAPLAEPEADDDDDALALSLDQVIDAEEESLSGEPEEIADFPDMSETEKFEVPDDVAFVPAEADEPDPEPPAYAGAMPDPKLSTDLAERLLDSTAQAAASDAFAKLGTLSLGAGGQTVEGIVRELLRPMLKSWLDENLPSVVERLVEREIERVSRGGR